MKTYIFIFTLIIAINSNLFTNHKFNNSNHTIMIISEQDMKIKTVKIKCEEMSCSACKRSITNSINKLKGIEKLDINLETKIITVSYNDAKTDEISILNAVIEAGYDAEIIK